MGHKGVWKYRRLPAKAKPLSKDNARGVISHSRADGGLAVEDKEAGIQDAYGPHPAPAAVISEAVSLKEQFYDNDSLGG